MSVFGDAELFEEFERQNGNDESASSDEESSGDSSEDVRSQKYKELLQENEKLKRTLRLLQRPRNIKVKNDRKDGPIAHVILFNNAISRKYQDEIQDFFYELCTRKVKDDEDTMSELQPTFVQYASPKSGGKQHKISSKRAEALTKAFQAFSSIQVYDKFYLDNLGQPLYFQDPNFSEWLLPQYEKVEFGPLSGDSFGIKQVKKSIQRICFNCGGTDHQIKDCEQERDYRAINQRRQKFMSEVAKFSQGMAQVRLGGSRYHKEDDLEYSKERFSRFKPGIVSSELQEALGMRSDAIPPYVYQMRRLGYPPGHLHSARIDNSGLSFYEEGEVNGRVQDDEYVPVDTSKLIGFPGFNIPPLPGQQDDFQDFGVPPVRTDQSKDVMISYLEHRNALYNRQKVNDSQSRECANDGTKPHDVDRDEVDMDMGDEEETNQCIFVVEDEVVSDADAIEEPTDSRSSTAAAEEKKDPGVLVVREKANLGTVVGDERKKPGNLVVEEEDPGIEVGEEQTVTHAFILDEEVDPGVIATEEHVGPDAGIFVAEDKTTLDFDTVEERAEPDVFVVETESNSDTARPKDQTVFVVDEESNPNVYVVEEQPIDLTDDGGEIEIEADVGDLTQEQLEVQREMLLKELRKTAGKRQDSDYRIIPDASQESTGDMVFAIEDSPESPPPEPVTIKSSSRDTDFRFTGVCTESDATANELSGDTDYRIEKPTSEFLPSPKMNQTGFEVSRTEQAEDNAPSSSKEDSVEPRLPGRHKFAEGISQFDVHYAETKQPGVYNKLRLLLKDSPRRKEK